MRLAWTFVFAMLLLACESEANLGAACTRASECPGALVCRFGRCRSECEANRDCGLAQSCLFSSDRVGACELAIDLGCETGVGRECSPGLVCANDRCINPCTVAADCPSDGACRFSAPLGLRVCVDATRESPDAGLRLDGSTAPLGCSVVSQVCVGEAFACAIRDGEVICWGDDTLGQHGDLVSGDFHPTHVLGPDMRPLDRVVEIGCGSRHVCARTSAGDVLCWGGNDVGQLARTSVVDGDRADLVQSEASITGPLEAVQIVVAGAHSCALRASGGWACWGQNANGEVDPDTAGMTRLVHPAAAFEGAVDVALGDGHACSVGAGSGVTCLGSADREEVGDPATLSALTGVTQLALGAHHSSALANARAFSWGSDGLGQIGDGDPPPAEDARCVHPPCLFTPSAVSLTGIERLLASATGDYTCAIADGEVWCWGDDAGATIDGSGSQHTAPVRHAGLARRACAAAAGGRTVCALLESPEGGEVWCWGENGNGQLGALPSAAVAIPARVDLGP